MNKHQTNEFSKSEENTAFFLKRLYIYQKERFPIIGHGLLVASFSFSAISYSLICRGVEGFVSLGTYFVGIFTTISLFMLVRIFDEFKDAEDDTKYRKNLPVPRGLISFKELLIMGLVLVTLQIAVNLYFFPKMLIIYFIVIAYLLLMGKEFFIADWLKKHQFWYVTSHMFIIPLIDIYASGLDWLLQGVDAPRGLIFFFAVSYMNGIVLEVGRKIRIPEKEVEGVLSYSSMLGSNKAIFLWILILFITYCLSIAASHYAGYGTMAFLILSIVFILCCIPAVIFLKSKTEKLSKTIELSSALWTIAMYLTLGGIPMLQKLIFN
ncbi:MAG TPA: UbiA family prenyltransferase [Saprospiraceae bacterium]|nr:UbiA family prenyltransferase [Saprospiraceae bacterium]